MIDVPGPPVVVELICTSVGLVKAAAGRASTVGSAIAHTNASTTTPAARRIALTLAPPSVSPCDATGMGSARSHVHEVADQVTDPECYARSHRGEGQLAERGAHA
jgi:hypothetical protein